MTIYVYKTVPKVLLLKKLKLNKDYVTSLIIILAIFMLIINDLL